MSNIIIIGGLGDLGNSIINKISKNESKITLTTRKINAKQKEKLENKFGVENINLLELDILSDLSINEFIKKLSLTGENYNGLVITVGAAYGNLIQMTSKKELIELFDVNLFSIFHLITKIVRIARKSFKNTGKEFSIVIFSSMYSFFNDYGSFAYGASKSALNYLIKNLSIELKSSGIRVNGVAPTVVKNPMGDLMSEISKEKLLKFSNSEKPIESEKISNIVNFLLSEESIGINGQIIKIS